MSPEERSEPIVSLSTMWSQGRFRKDGDERDSMIEFANKAVELGFSYAEINYVIPPEGVDELIESGLIAFSSVHSPCPRVKVGTRHSEALNLASKDETERKQAVQVAKDSVDTAVRANTKLLVVHLGGLPNVFDEEKKLRKMFDEGTQSGEEFARLGKQAIERRHKEAPSHFPHAKQSLADIAEYAAAKGVTIGLENRYHYHEYPDPDEMQVLLADYPPEVAGFWLDIGHAEVLDRLGFLPHTRWLDELSSRCVGTHVHDVDGLADHRAPGFGTADWPHYTAKLPAHIPRVNEINQRQDEDRVGGAIAYLRSVGALPKI
ncbi:MAG: sugar phosphate isomerase/epimerase [Chloroflexota bacterium]